MRLNLFGTNQLKLYRELEIAKQNLEGATNDLMAAKVSGVTAVMACG
jgi:hypothetical protein